MNKIILIKWFLTGVLYYCFKLIYAYLNEGDQFCECYRCLKMVILDHLHVSFFTIFFIKCVLLKPFYLSLKLSQSRTTFKQYFSSNVYYLNHSIYLWNCRNQGRLLNEKVIMKCLPIKIFAWNFLQLLIQNK